MPRKTAAAAATPRPPNLTADLLSGLESMVGASPIGYGFVSHPSHQIAYVNASLARMAGMSPNAMVGKSPVEVFGEELTAQVAPTVSAALQSPDGHAEIEVDADVGGRTGSPGVYRLNVHAVRDGGGDLAGAWLVVYEVTKERRLETHTRHQKRHLQAVMDVVPTGVLVADRDGKLLYANQEAERIWGHPLIDAASPTDYSQYRLYHDDGTRTDPEETILAKTLQTRSPLLRSRRLVKRPDGSQIIVLANSVPLLDESGDLTGAVVAFHDVTELQNLQQRQQRLTQIAQAVNADRRLHDVLRMVRDAVVETTGLERAGLWLYDEALAGIRGTWGTDLDGAARDESAEVLPLAPTDDHPWARVLSGEIAVYRAMEPPQDVSGSEPGEPYCDGAVLGLAADERVIGMLFVDNGVTGKPVSEDAIDLLIPFCEQAATAIERARLRQTEREQTKWLQDAVRITNHRVKNNLQVALAILDTELIDEGPVDRSTLERIRRQIRIIGSVNEFLGDSSPEIEASLGEILERVLGVFEAGRSAACTLDCNEVVVSTKQATAAGLIVDELVSFAERRGATRVDVTLRLRGGEVTIELLDNGERLPAGFKVDPNVDKALGLVERLSRWDLLGRAHYANQPEGVCVAVSFPREAKAA